MNSTRRARLASIIQEEVSLLINREIKDPRIGNITITSVDVAEDGSHATLYITPSIKTHSADELKSKETTQDCLKGLESASGFMRRHLAKILTIRHIPTLAFKEDRGLTNVLRVHELLQKLSTERSAK